MRHALRQTLRHGLPHMPQDDRKEPAMNLMPPQTVTRTGELVDSMLGVKQYAEHVGAGERTVRTWLADGRLHSARKLNGVWMIGADDRPADPMPPAGELDAVARIEAGLHMLPHMPQHELEATPAPRRLVDELDASPVFLPLDDAARILGVSSSAIRGNRGTFGVVPFGPRGSLVVPQAIIRTLAGIR
jgi:hypothetical protein